MISIDTLLIVLGTTAEDFRLHIQGLLARPAIGHHRILLWDNLRSHSTAETIHLVYAAGHTVIPRPPYNPGDGAIEYAFSTLDQKLQLRRYEITTENELVHATLAILAEMEGFDNYFIHCGY